MNATYITSIGSVRDLPISPTPHIALIGRSNVGKSSLINHLTGQKNLARVSAVPGKTQTVNLFEIDREYILADLPGYGYAKTSKEKRQVFAGLIWEYLRTPDRIRLALLIIDARVGITSLDEEMLYELADKPFEVILILNKSDKCSRQELDRVQRQIRETYPGMRTIVHSSMNTTGKSEVLKTIKEFIS